MVDDAASRAMCRSRGPAATKEIVDEVVQGLCQISRAATMEFALKVGELVFQKIYGGDIEALRRRGPKDQSFRRLASHPSLPFSAATLWRSVAIFDLVQRFPGVVQMRHLGVAHVRAILGLPGDVQERILREAESERWTKERIEERAALHRQRSARRGRPPVPPLLKVLARIDRVATQCSVPEEALAVRRAGSAQERRALEAIQRLRAFCDAVEESLKREAE